MLAEQGQQGLALRRAAAQEQGHHPFVDQTLSIGRTESWVVFVVQRDQLDGLTLDAALGIDGVEIQARTVGDFLHAGGCRSAETRRLADLDLRLGQTAAPQARQ